jgi:hypothetical protein
MQETHGGNWGGIPVKKVHVGNPYWKVNTKSPILHCRKSWRIISFPSDISELFYEDISTNISEKCSP